MEHFLVNIEASKSVCNRHLIFRSLAGLPINALNLSSADDVETLKQIVSNPTQHIWDVGHAGTAFRFLTAFATLQKNEVIITGSDRLKERPIHQLVEVLRSLGADIIYLEKEGFAPLCIRPKILEIENVKLPVLKSSQFISALLLIAPFLNKPLQLEFHPDQPSMSYINLTLEVLEYYGVEVEQNGGSLEIGLYQTNSNCNYRVESDWSSASYWYSISAIFGVQVQLTTFSEYSKQGDSVLMELFETFGVKSKFDDGVLTLKSYPKKRKEYLELNCKNCPDIAQTILVTAFVLGVSCELYGLSTLADKECNRLEAMKNELIKFGGQLEIKNNDSIYLGVSDVVCTKPTQINTYNDHRMAMAFTPLFMLFADLVEIENPGVVSKSYPRFWDDLNDLISFMEGK